LFRLDFMVPLYQGRIAVWVATVALIGTMRAHRALAAVARSF
jgi:hypothetical protein